MIKGILKTKFTVLSSENFSSLFARDCVENNVSLFYNMTNTMRDIIKNGNENKIIALDFNNLDQSISVIEDKINYKKEENYNFIKFSLDKDINEEILILKKIN